jgi:DNA polymerase III subunit epsilon
MLDRPLVFLDLETTGATAHFDRITEIGLVEVDRGDPVGEWSSLVNPQRRIPPGIQALTGINDRMVADAPTFEDLAPALFERLDGKVLVAHNARFDYGFLRNEFRRVGLRYAPKVLCTVKLSRRLFPQERRHNLDSLIQRHGLACDNRHRALADARVLWEFTRQIHRDLDAAMIRDTVDELLRAPSLPSHLDAGAVDDIPDGPGVYVFYGDGDAALYVGKSVNLRTRVMSHFSGDHSIAKDMEITRKIRRIDWTETTGDFGACVVEARLIKQLAPALNRRLRKNGSTSAFHWNPAGGADVPRLVNVSEVDFSASADLFGLFRSKPVANNALREIADANGLCLIRLGLERGKGPCFNHQLKRCRGACVGKESERAHQMRLAAALAPLRVKSWPFPGRIGVRETDPTNRRAQVHVFDRWAYVGTMLSQLDLFDALETRFEPGFDLDTYKLLQRLFRDTPGNIEIIRLPAADGLR